MDNWNQMEQQSNTKTKRIRLEQVFYFRVGMKNKSPESLAPQRFSGFIFTL